MMVGPGISMSASIVSRSVPPALEADLLEAIRDVSPAIVHRLVPFAVAEGLGAPTFWPLHYLARGKDLHPGDLARRFGITPATCTWIMDQLVALGFVVRRPSHEDRRQVLLSVTPKGRRALTAIWRKFDESMDELLVGVSSRDVETAAQVLRTIADRSRPPLSPTAGGSGP